MLKRENMRGFEDRNWPQTEMQMNAFSVFAPKLVFSKFLLLKR
jgi:hypothetical protein